MKMYTEAKKDYDAALDICQSEGFSGVKALLRRGKTWLGLQDPAKALVDFQHAAMIEPNNR